MGHDDRTAVRQGVCRRACRRAHYQSVGMIRHDVFAVDERADGNHRGVVALEHGNLIERTLLHVAAVAARGLHLHHGKAVHHVFPVIHAVEHLLYVVHAHTGKESEPSHVHSDNRRAAAAHAMDGSQERSVASHRHHVVGIHILPVERFHAIELHTACLYEEVVERLLHAHACPPPFEGAEQMLYPDRFVSLVNVAEYGEFEFAQRHITVF